MLKIQLYLYKQQCQVLHLKQPKMRLVLKIDNQVRSLAYVKSVETQSIQNASIVTVEYNNGTDMDKEEVLKEIDKLDFKDGVSEPELTRNSMDAFPIVAYSFTNKMMT